MTPGGGEHSQRADPLDIRAQYEKLPKGFWGSFGETLLELCARKNTRLQ